VKSFSEKTKLSLLRFFSLSPTAYGLLKCMVAVERVRTAAIYTKITLCCNYSTDWLSGQTISPI
jgi:hypothetical protein